MTIGTYNGVGTFYELDVDDDLTTLRLLCSSGPGGSVIKEMPYSLENQRLMARLMVDSAIDEVVEEMRRS